MSRDKGRQKQSVTGQAGGADGANADPSSAQGSIQQTPIPVPANAQTADTEVVDARPAKTNVKTGQNLALTPQTEMLSFHPSGLRAILGDIYDFFEKFKFRNLFVNIGTSGFTIGFTGILSWINDHTKGGQLSISGLWNDNRLYLALLVGGVLIWLACKCYSVVAKEDDKKKFTDKFMKQFADEKEDVMVVEKDVREKDKHVILKTNPPENKGE